MSVNHTQMSIAAIRSALSFIPAEVRRLWLRIGMALKSELGEEGFALFSDWSATGESFDLKAVKATWKSIKPGGKVTMATLVAEAKKGGFNPKDFAPAVPLSRVEIEKIAATRAAKEARVAEEQAATHRAAAAKAAVMWDGAETTGASQYLVRKNVEAIGVRFSGKAMLVPLRDEHGKLWNLQRIYANGSKYVLEDCRVSGCFHQVGEIGPNGWILVAEGYATAVTLHQATGLTVVVAFNDGNMGHVALGLRNKYPSAMLLFCADDDSATAVKTGSNAGVVAAQAAANAVGGIWCKPEGLPTGKTDFNDLAAAAGLAAVIEQITKALEGFSQVPAFAVASAIKPTLSLDVPMLMATADAPTAADPKAATAVKKKRESKSSTRQGEKPSGPFFSEQETGVWFHGFDRNGDPATPIWVCSLLNVTAQSRDVVNGEWGYLLEFCDADGNPKKWAMPASMLAGDGTQYRSILLGMGLQIGAGVTAKNQLTVYIQTQKTDVRVRCTDRIGWHDDVYVLPDRTIGEGEEKVMFQAPGGVVSQFRQRGTLLQWQREVATHCRGNSRMVFCVAAAFAAPLMHLARIPSGGFHIWGDSSSGKSTAFKVAGSVFGGKDYPRNWRMTDNALETVAAQHSDALLLLDEIAQVDPKVVGDTVYMLANETGKGRATQTATARKVSTWRVLFLSDGEISLANHMEQAGKGTKAGHDVRMAHIAADAGKGLGVYDTLHDFPNGAAMSDHLVNMAHQYYGAAGMALVEYAVENAAALSKMLIANVGALAADMCPVDSHGQVSRVAARFALVGIAGEVASDAGISGWESGEATAAARTCFAAWLQGRGGSGNVEHLSILRQVTGFFQAHGDARFTWWHRATDDHKPSTLNRAGFKRLISHEGAPISSHNDHRTAYGDKVHPVDAEGSEQEYFVLPEVFRTEICKGFNPKTVTKLLIDRGMLMPEGTTSATRKERLPGLGTVRCYRFNPVVLGT